MHNQKVTAILASPQREGITAQMMNYAVLCAKEKGYQVTVLYLDELHIASCTGCRHCANGLACSIQDDQQLVAAQITSSDVILLASPTYWANIPGSLKTLLDRLLGVLIQDGGRLPKPQFTSKKEYMLLTSCNTPPLFSMLSGQARGALHAMKEPLHRSGMRCKGSIVFAGAQDAQELPDKIKRKIENCWK